MLYLLYVFTLLIVICAICWEFTLNVLLWLALFYQNPTVIKLTNNQSIVLRRNESGVYIFYYDRVRGDREGQPYHFTDEDVHRIYQFLHPEA